MIKDAGNNERALVLLALQGGGSQQVTQSNCTPSNHQTPFPRCKCGTEKQKRFTLHFHKSLCESDQTKKLPRIYQH